MSDAAAIRFGYERFTYLKNSTCGSQAPHPTKGATQCDQEPILHVSSALAQRCARILQTSCHHQGACHNVHDIGEFDNSSGGKVHTIELCFKSVVVSKQRETGEPVSRYGTPAGLNHMDPIEFCCYRRAMCGRAIVEGPI